MSSVWAVENDRKLEKRTADFMLDDEEKDTQNENGRGGWYISG